MQIGTVELVGLLLAPVGLCGLACAVGSYVLVPWERLNGAGRFPVGPGTVRLTRLGVSLGFLLTVPLVVGTWAASVRATAPTAPLNHEPTRAETLATTLPGELIATGSLVIGMGVMLGALGLLVGDLGLAVFGRLVERDR